MDVEIDVVEDDKSEGEISSDDEISGYIPLERPTFLHAQNIHASKIDEYDRYHSDEANESRSNDSDSDSDTNTFRPKKPKVRPRYKRPMSRSQKPNKYNIWSNRAQEDSLTENLVSCDVANVDRSRDVETYNVPDRIRNKRTFDDRSNVHLRLGKRASLDDDEEKKGSPRLLLDLTVTMENTEDEVATDISNKLFEEKDDLLKRIVSVSGKEKAIKLFNQTKSIEADGGMLIMNQTRRRTPGGVYFFLVKRDDELTEDQKRDIFQEERRTKKEKKANLRRKSRMANRDGAKGSNHLPNLLCRAEIELAKGGKSRRDSNDRIDEHVSNPPPSPVTDGKEASSDEMVEVVVPKITAHPNPEQSIRMIQSYEDDFLEIGGGSDVEVFS